MSIVQLEDADEVKEMLGQVEQVIDVKKIKPYFIFKTDLVKGMRPFKVCGHYPFHRPPVLKMHDGFVFVLEPKLLAELLYAFAKDRYAPSVHASQIGVNYDFFIVVNPTEEKDRGPDEPEYETFINSRIVALSDEGEKKDEICASYPAIYLKIERPLYSDVLYLDVNAQENRERLSGDWSRYFVQNYCLSRGKPFWTFASKISQDMAIKRRNKKLGKELKVNRLI